MLKEVEPMILGARQQLRYVRDLRQSLSDARIERTDFVLEELEAKRLTEYSLTPIRDSDATTTSPPKPTHDDPDVMISYCTSDQRAARWLSKVLRANGIDVWLDERAIRAGSSWQTALTRVLETVPSALVLVGPSGLGAWQNVEVQKLLVERNRRGVKIIPVRLPGNGKLLSLLPISHCPFPIQDSCDGRRRPETISPAAAQRRRRSPRLTVSRSAPRC